MKLKIYYDAKYPVYGVLNSSSSSEDFEVPDEVGNRVLNAIKEWEECQDLLQSIMDTREEENSQ